MSYKTYTVRTGEVEISLHSYTVEKINDINEWEAGERKKWIEKISHFDDYWGSHCPRSEFVYDTLADAEECFDSSIMYLLTHFDKCRKLLFVEFIELWEEEWEGEDYIQGYLLNREWSDKIRI